MLQKYKARAKNWLLLMLLVHFLAGFAVQEDVGAYKKSAQLFSKYREPRAMIRSYPSVVVISIGSESRRELHRVQGEKLGRHVQLYQFTETNLPNCTLCNITFKGETHPDGILRSRFF